ncbi:MAG: hypothetical protein E7421_07260 [Ruminococcaceae bacterium]|nr:hypothetical protein [Oscillospiraceae bacterium]
MKDAYPYFIFLSIIGLLMSILLAYIYKKEKNKNPYFLIAAFLLFLLPFLMTLGMVLNSEKFISAAFLFPIALFMIATSIELLIRYKNCTCVVSAKCVSFTRRGKGHYYIPEFSYNYGGEHFSICSFVSYRKRKFKKNFAINHVYDIYVNPRNPKQCIDKRFYPVSNIFILVISIIFLVFSAIIVIYV